MPHLEISQQSFAVSAVSYGTLTLVAQAGSVLTNLYKDLVGNLVDAGGANSIRVKVRAIVSPGVATCVLWDGKREGQIDLAAYNGGALYFEPQLAYVESRNTPATPTSPGDMPSNPLPPSALPAATPTAPGTVPQYPIPQAGVVGLVKSLNAQTGTTYVLAAADACEQGTSLVTLSNANPITVTVPNNATVPIDVGQSFNIQQIGEGQVTFAPVDGDVTINPAGTLKISAQWKAATLVKTATNVWSLIGSLSA